MPVVPNDIMTFYQYLGLPNLSTQQMASGKRSKRIWVAVEEKRRKMGSSSTREEEDLLYMIADVLLIPASSETYNSHFMPMLTAWHLPQPMGGSGSHAKSLEAICRESWRRGWGVGASFAWRG
ncbi:hypothetical protein ColLi_13107 [Colletotrichum liriopes]|uniref:Uncharacterized protein n=1 Tax=Colletotrichum liriopes TaxID=708192 RepID=A0AA37GZL1_9PEZI|nr:hypothetical protein ColLi_13107 [Colletotrichum liriopes]